MKGSPFNSFLRDEKLLVETTSLAVKRIFSRQVTKIMQAKGIGKSEMARCMSVTRATLDRLLDENKSSVTLKTMCRAALVLDVNFCLVLSCKNDSITISREEYRQLTNTKRRAKRALKAIDNEDIVQAGIELRLSRTGLKAISREGEE